jgi:large subunit ribosomal protein L10
MDNPRTEKVAIVEEVRGRLNGAGASVVTEYRGLSVSDLASLRRSLAAAGSDYKIFKNTLVRIAVDGGQHEPLRTFLSGPTAIAFVNGDLSAVAKVLRDFSRAHNALVLKGGLADGALLSQADLVAMADLPSREVLLARLAGAIAAPLQQFAGLLQALPRNLAYGLSALIDQQGGAPEATEATTAEPEAAEPQAAEPEAAEPEATDATTAEPEATEATTAENAAAEQNGDDSAS